VPAIWVPDVVKCSLEGLMRRRDGTLLDEPLGAIKQLHARTRAGA
jgi:hypothetical protein